MWREKQQQTARQPVIHAGSENSRAVSGTANSSGVDIWFQSEATNNKFCVLISVWAPGVTQNHNQDSAGSRLSVCATTVCVNMWSPSLPQNRRAESSLSIKRAESNSHFLASRFLLHPSPRCRTHGEASLTEAIKANCQLTPGRLVTSSKKTLNQADDCN